jgi:hypothetical protein
VEGVVVGERRGVFGRAPGGVLPPRQMAKIERIVLIKFGAGLLLERNTLVRIPMVLALAFDLKLRADIQIDGGHEGELARRVHDDAVVVIFELVPGADFRRQVFDRRHQFRQRRRKAEESRIEARPVGIMRIRLARFESRPVRRTGGVGRQRRGHGAVHHGTAGAETDGDGQRHGHRDDARLDGGRQFRGLRCGGLHGWYRDVFGFDGLHLALADSDEFLAQILPGIDGGGRDEIHQARGADALVGDPVDLIGVAVGRPHLAIEADRLALRIGARDAGVMQRHDLPLVVEHRRAGRARLGVGFIIGKLIDIRIRLLLRQVEQLVFADDDLFQFPFGMLHHVDRLADDDLAFRADQRAKAERRDRRAVGRARRDGDQAEIERLIGEKEPGRIEPERLDREHGVAAADLIIELRGAAHGVVGAREHVVIGDQQRRRDQEAGAEAFPVVQGRGDLADRAAGRRAFVEKLDREKVARLADDPLEHFIADIGGGDRALRRQLVKGHFLAKCLAPRLTGRIARIRDGRQQPVGVFGEPLLRFRFGVVALFDRGHFGLTRTLTRFPPLRGLRRHLRIERAAVAWSTHD